MQRRVTFAACTTISKSTGHAVIQDTADFLIADEITFIGSSVQVTAVIDR